jgi:galactokinase
LDTRTNDLVEHFRHSFGRDPQAAVRAPGRVNLIGEHTDYNDGFCLPMAIDRDMRICWASRDDRQVRLANASRKDGDQVFDLDGELSHDADTPWYDYVQGCAKILLDAGYELRGADLAFDGNVPLGSGLSSSAALEVATIHALTAASGIEIDGTTIATLAQRAENTFVGVNCGILDQLSSACCQVDRAMLMDCRSLELTQAPLPAGVAIVIADTGKRRGLVDSAYNERRSQCEAGAAALGVSHLRDVNLQGLMMAEHDAKIDALTKARCEHVVAENGRTLAAVACLQAGDPVAMGALMDQSHADLRDKFQVTCPELDWMVAIARDLPGCLGARMTGAGFGGCTVALVEREQTEAFVAALLDGYGRRFDLPAAAYVTGAAAGAGALPL